MSFNGSSGDHLYTVYSAPRGRDRMYQLGMKIAQEHLSPADRVIGVIGEAGSGKSMIIKGMFPVRTSRTGWLPPRWPYLSFMVFPPIASAVS